MKKTLAVVGTLMVATAFVLGGCGDDDDSSEEEATIEYCSDLDALGEALADIRFIGDFAHPGHGVAIFMDGTKQLPVFWL